MLVVRGGRGKGRRGWVRAKLRGYEYLACRRPSRNTGEIPPYGGDILDTQRRDPNFSPDGRRVVFMSTRSGELEMWVADAAGGNAIQLTSMGLIPGFGRWSPDGTTIVFHSNPEGQGDVLAVAADGGKPRNLTPDSADGTFPSYSRDGRSIYFSSTRGGRGAIWKMPRLAGRRSRSPRPRRRQPSNRSTAYTVPCESRRTAPGR